MTDDELSQIETLPLAELERLTAAGKLVSVTTFAEHMRPDVHWIEPEEFGKAFNDLIAGADVMAGMEAAHTSSDPSYPGFINATLGLDEMVVTVRADPKPGEPGTVPATESDPLGQGPASCGPMAQIRIALADWDAFIVQAQRVRGGTAE